MVARRLSTRETAARLGVKPETVYAYVSRGLLTSARGVGGRGSTFDAAEVAALRARHGAGRASTGVVESVTTGLTLLADDEVSFRGHPLADLVVTPDPQRVAGLLWRGDLDAGVRFTSPGPVVDDLRPVVDGLPTTARLTDRVRVAVTALAAADPWRFDLSPDAVVRAGASLVRGMVEVIAPPGPPTAGLAELLWPALTAAPPRPHVLDTALVLLADHGLAVSTLTARVAASARSPVYAVVSAGLGALDGPMHGTASTAAYRFLAEARDDPGAALAERVRAGERIPGFGHTIYRARDPRTALLMATIAGTDEAALVDDLTARVAGRPGLFPNIDLALAAVARAHGMRPDAGETIFAVARTVGWVAHSLEEYAERGLRYRVEGHYTGPYPPSAR